MSSFEDAMARYERLLHEMVHREGYGYRGFNLLKEAPGRARGRAQVYESGLTEFGFHVFTETLEMLRKEREAASRRLTAKAVRAIEANFENQREAFVLLDLIDAEFRTDPMSVQCFDLKIVERVRQCVAARKQHEENGPWG